MEEYNVWSLLSPWVGLLILLVPIMYTERWIHQHSFGIVYLLNKKDAMAATRLFYAFFFPGIFLHEFIQYIVAGLLNVPIKKIRSRPQEQTNGTMRLDFVVVNHEKSDRVKSAIVAASPFMVMSGLVWYIATQRLRLDEFGQSLGSGDISSIWDGFQNLVSAPHFLLWTYLLFVIANTMVPKREDAKGVPLLAGIAGVIIAVMVITGMDEVVVKTLSGPVAQNLSRINTALLTILGLNIAAMLTLGLIEDGIEKIRGEKMNYSGEGSLTRATKAAARVPGSDEPYPKGELLPSIYNLNLSVPDPDEKPSKARPQPARPAAAPAFGTAAGTSLARPATAFSASRAQDQPERPASSQSAAPPATAEEKREERAGRPSLVARDKSADEASVTPARPATEAERSERLEGAIRRPAPPAESTAGKPERPTSPTRPAGMPERSPAGEPQPSRFGAARSESAENEPPARPGAFARRETTESTSDQSARSSFFNRGEESGRPAAPTDRPARPTGQPGDESPARPGAFARRETTESTSDQPARSSFFNRGEESGRSAPPADRPARPAGIGDQQARPAGRVPAAPPSSPASGFRPAPRPGQREASTEMETQSDLDDTTYEDFDDIMPTDEELG